MRVFEKFRSAKVFSHSPNPSPYNLIFRLLLIPIQTPSETFLNVQVLKTGVKLFLSIVFLTVIWLGLLKCFTGKTEDIPQRFKIV